MLMCFCAGFFAMFSPAHAVASAPSQTDSTSSKNAAKRSWDFQAPDRSGQNARWRESISVTLQQTTFAPSAPAGRYLHKNETAPGKRLPPAQLDDLDKIRSPEKTQFMLGGRVPVHGEFVKESTVWRPYSGLADDIVAAAPLREERRAGAYAGLHPGEDVELKLGPEYHLGTSVLRPAQTGYSKDSAGTFGMGLRLKIDF